MKSQPSVPCELIEVKEVQRYAGCWLLAFGCWPLAVGLWLLAIDFLLIGACAFEGNL